MKKVLYITTVSRTINAFLIPHIEMLISKGYIVHCACSVDKPIDRGLLGKGVKVFEVPFSRNPFGFGNIKAFFKLMEIQRINDYDIVHVHTPIASIYERLLKVRFRKLKTIYTAHGYHFLEGGSKSAWKIYYPIEKLMAKLTDVTININKEDYEITDSKLKPKSSYLINGVGLDLSKYCKLPVENINKLREELGYKADDFIVLMIAELNENKNQIQLIKAMELLKDKYPNIKALSVGEGDKLLELMGQVKERGLENNFKFMGFRNDINELINISNIGVLLSYREGLPRNLMELMACGRKVIGTDIRGCRDIICKEEIGKLVKVGDYEDTAKKIEEYYLQGDKEFKVLEEIEKYNVENVNYMIWNVYHELQRGVAYDEKGYSYSPNE